VSTVDAGLDCAGTYTRRVGASLGRVWENVFDWEHLSALHEQDFHAVELLESSPSGWRVRLVNQPGDRSRAQLIAMTADKSGNRYEVVTVDGPGKGSTVRTTLRPIAPRRTAIMVEFLVPRGARDLAEIGRRYREMYVRLWDQDEAMMRHRERALARRRLASRKPRTKLLGGVDEVYDRAPFVVTFGGDPYRIVVLDDLLVAHATTCPHWLGPLDGATIVDGCIRCPWHGYRFDIRTGASVDGHGLKLHPAPSVVIKDGTVSLRRA